MPIFEYRCKECEHAFEELVRSSRPNTPEALCPRCGSASVERQFSVFGVPSAVSSPSTRPEGPCGSHCTCFPRD